MPFWLVALLWVGSFVLGELLRPKPKFEAPQPSALGDFRIPTAEEGRCIPWLVGTCKIDGGNVVWYGDLEVRPIRKKVKTGIFSSQKITTGFQYFLGEQIVLCMGPIDQVVEVRFDDKSVGSGAITIVSGKNQVVFGNTPPPWETAVITPAIYADATALAIGTEEAMDAEDPGTWKVPYGFHLVPGRSSELVYAVQGDFGGGLEATDITIDVGGVYLTGRDAALAVAAAINYSERRQVGGARVEVTVDYDEVSGHFLIGWIQLRSTVAGFWLRGIVDYDKTALVNLGYQPGVDHFGSGSTGTLEGEFEVRDLRYTFGFGGVGGKLDLDSPDFTAKDVFGIGGSGQPTMPVLAASDRGVPSFISYFPLSADITRVVINAPDLFGGPEREGGIVGTIDIFMGTTTQEPSDYLEAVLGTRLPAYRRVCYAVHRHLYQGTSPYLKNPGYILSAFPNELALVDDHHVVSGGDANPLAMLYKLCIDPYFLAAIPEALVDADTFRALGEIVYAEGLGVSMLTDNQSAAGDLAGEILRHVDGVMYVDPFTGKLTAALARDDYDVDDLLLVDEKVYSRESEDSETSTLEFSRPSWDETRNVVKVRFCDRSSNYTERIAQEQDNANIQTRQGQRSVETIDFLGLSNYTNAQKAAARCLRTLTYPLAAISFSANRKTWKLRPGSVFKLTSARYGVTELPCRVTRTQVGDPRDGRIRIDAVEDIFGLDRPSYTNPTPGWTDPGVTPQSLAAERLEEAPYAIVGGTDRRIMTMGAVGATPIDGYHVWSDPAGGTAYTDTQTVPALTPFGTLVGTVGPADDAIVFTGGDVSTLVSIGDTPFAAGQNLLLLDDEWIAWRDIVDNGNGSWTISHLARGCLDSTPREHFSGADCWFTSFAFGWTQDDPYADDDLIAAKLRTYRGAESVALALCARLTVQLDSRTLRPSCPALVRINGESYPATIGNVGDLVLTWAHRDRTGAGGYDVQNSTPAIESGTHYRVRIYGGDGVLKHTEDGLTAETWTYTQAAEMADNSGDLNAQLRIVIDAIQDAGDELESRQAFDWTVDRGSVAPPPSTNAAGRILIRPTDMTGDGGTSTRGSGSSTIAVRNFPQLSDRTETSTFAVPDDFTELLSIEVIYCNTNTSTNPWVARVGLRVLSDGVDGTDPPTFGTQQTITPPATQDQVDIVTLPLPAVSLVAGDEVQLVLQRKPGGAAGDTNTDNMAVIGVRLTYG